MTHICSICGRDEQAREEMIAVLKDNGFSGDTMNPGGRYLCFRDRAGVAWGVHVSDYCMSCDADRVREAAKKRNARPDTGVTEGAK